MRPLQTMITLGQRSSKCFKRRILTLLKVGPGGWGGVEWVKSHKLIMHGQPL